MLQGAVQLSHHLAAHQESSPDHLRGHNDYMGGHSGHMEGLNDHIGGHIQPAPVRETKSQPSVGCDSHCEKPETKLVDGSKIVCRFAALAVNVYPGLVF